MRSACLVLSVVFACSDDHSHSDVILVNNASDEVATALEDLEGEIMANNGEAAMLTMPVSGAPLPADTPPTFAWVLPTSGPTPRHGTASGTFIWLRFTGEGIHDGKVDVVAVNVSQWTPTAEQWEQIASATGTVTVRLVTCIFDDAVRVPGEGPWRYDPDATFTLQR